MFKKKEVKKEIKKKEVNKKKTKQKSDLPKIKRINIKEAIPFTFDAEKKMFIDNNGNYLMMVRTYGTNLFGFKDADKYAFVNALSKIFNNSIGRGQIYSYQVGADVDGYVNDFQYFKDQLDLSNEIDITKYEILEQAQKRLKYTALTKDLVDRCFVFILKGKDIFDLETRCKEIISALGSYQKTEMIDFTDTFLILYNYYHPIQSKLFEEMGKEAEDVMDFLYPTRIGMVDIGFKQCVELDGVYCKTRFISDFRREIAFALMSYLATAGDLDFSLHFMPAEQDAITKSMDKTLRNIDKNLNKAKESSTITKLQTQAQETQGMMDKVIAEGSQAFYFSVFVRIKGDSVQQVNEISRELDNSFASFGVRFRDGVFEPLEMFNMSAPICYDVPDRFYKVTTIDTMGYMYPFVFEALYDSTPYKQDVNYPPVYIGNTIQTNGVVFYDNFTKKEDRSNYNEFIVGKTGAGKTFFLMWLIYNRFGLGYKQYLIDVEGKELNKLTYALNGINIDCSNGDNGRINPLQIRFNIPDSDTGEGKVPLDEIFPLSQHIRFLREFLNAYKGDSNEIGLLHESIIEKAIITVYGNLGINFNTSAQYIVEHFKNEDYPILSDVYDEIKKQLDDLKSSNELEEAESERYKVCLAFLEPIAYGTDSNLFNGHTNVDLSNPLINFNISGLQDNTTSRVLGTQYFNIMSYIWTDIISDPTDTRKQLYADEFSVIMDTRYKDIMKYFQTVIKRIRKRYGGLTTATQQISDVLKSSVKEEGEAIIEGSVYQFYFSLGTEGISYFKNNTLIPESEQEFIQFAGIGECYAKIGTSTAMRVRILIDDEVFELFKRIKRDVQ